MNEEKVKTGQFYSEAHFWDAYANFKYPLERTVRDGAYKIFYGWFNPDPKILPKGYMSVTTAQEYYPEPYRDLVNKFDYIAFIGGPNSISYYVNEYLTVGIRRSRAHRRVSSDWLIGA